MKVAWHEMPGERIQNDPSRRARCERATLNRLPQRFGTNGEAHRRAFILWPILGLIDHTVPYGTDLLLDAFQALRARLPSSCPHGTNLANRCPNFRNQIKRVFEHEDELLNVNQPTQS